METFLTFAPLVIVLGFNAIIGIIAMKMATKRGLKSVPAFWAAVFGSVAALFIIAMHPIQEK